jgi:MFS family permease
MVATGMSFILLAPNTSVVFLYSYLTSKGLGPAAAAAAVAGVSGMQVVSRVVFWLPMIARLNSVRRIVLLWGSLLLTSTLILALADSPAWAYVAAGVLGVGLGGSLVLLLQIWPEYFGRRAIGTIIGTAQALQGVSSATVPFLLAALLDRTGSFTLLYLIVAVFVLTGLALHVIVGKPTRQGLEP